MNGLNIQVNGVNTTAGWGLKTRAPLSASAAGFLIHGREAATPDAPVPSVLAFGLTGTGH